MSLIANCIDKLAKVGRIDARTAAAAKALHEGVTARIAETIPGGDAAARAALDVARIMAESAKARKWALAKDALKLHAATERVNAHPHSRAAGAMALLSRDIRQKASGPNVFSQAEVIEGELLKPLTPFLEKYAASILQQAKGLVDDVTGGKLGLVDTTSMRNIVRELRGVETNDAAAKGFAKGWKETTAKAVEMAKAAGYVFNEKADWVTPQFWSSERVRKLGSDAFTRDLMQAWDLDALRITRDDGSAITSRLEAEQFTREAAKQIAVGEGGGGAPAFAASARRFNFNMDEAGADAWIRLFEAYGGGRDIVGMLRGHIQQQARAIALAEVLGPNHGANVQQIAKMLREEKADGKLSKWNPIRAFESAAAFERTYKVAIGAVDAVEGEILAGVLGGVRHLHVASSMGSGIVSAVFSDPSTLMLASSHVGMSGGQVLRRAVTDLAAMSGEERAALAAQTNLVAHSVSDVALGGARYADVAMDGSTMSRVSSLIIRAQGLQGWTEALKRAWTLEFTGFAARQAQHAWDNLDPAFRGFLQRHGFTAKDWTVLRAAPSVEHEGARFFDHTAVADRDLGRRFMGAILDERGYAVLEPDHRVRQVTTAGAGRGTFAGEMARSISLYKSFSISMMLMHGMRSMQLIQEGRAASGVAGAAVSAAAYLAPLLVTLTLGGALAIQARQLLQGKDPKAMDNPDFWGEAFMQGGGGGIYADLMNQAYTRSGTSLVSTLMGPAAGVIDQAARLTFNQVRRDAEGQKVTLGRELADTLRRYTPGSSLWYSRLVVDRLIFDAIQSQIDPEYASSWARERTRIQRDFGQDFYWQRGDAAPERGPTLF